MRKAAPSFFLRALWKSANKQKLAGEAVSRESYHNAGGEDDNGAKYFVVRFQLIRQNSLCNLIKSREKNYGLSFKTPELNLARNRLSLFPQGGPPYHSISEIVQVRGKFRSPLTKYLSTTLSTCDCCKDFF